MGLLEIHDSGSSGYLDTGFTFMERFVAEGPAPLTLGAVKLQVGDRHMEI